MGFLNIFFEKNFSAGLKSELKLNSESWKRKLSIISYRMKFYYVHVKPNRILLIIAKVFSVVIDFWTQSRSLPGQTFIGYGLKIPHGFDGVFISQYAVIGANCVLYHNVTIGVIDGEEYSKGEIVIGDDVLMGAGATLLGKCNIGSHVKIGANALVVSEKVLPSSLVLAPKAKIITK